MNPRKTLDLILNGSHNVRFADFVRLVDAVGFRFSRVSGSHHVFSRPALPRPSTSRTAAAKRSHISEAAVAKAAWLESARAEGRPIPPPRYRPAVYELAGSP